LIISSGTTRDYAEKIRNERYRIWRDKYSSGNSILYKRINNISVYLKAQVLGIYETRTSA